MENLWIFYSLGGLLALGLWDFCKKLVLSKWWNKEVFLLVCFLLYVSIFFINMLFQWTWDIDRFTLQSWIILWINNFFIPLWVMISLKYLDTWFSLISIRIISAFLILGVWLFMLWDILSFYDYLWFFLWMIAIFLLSWFKLWSWVSIHKKWIIWIVISIVWIVFLNSYFKYIVPNINVHDFMLVQFTTTLICLIIYMLIRNKMQYLSVSEVKKTLPYALPSVCVFVVHFLYLLPNIYLLWPLSLGYKMLSYSLVVPIILSIIFLEESIDKRRGIAFLLTVGSIFLFII